MSKNKNINVLDRYKRYSIINNIIEEKIKNAEKYLQILASVQLTIQR